MAFVNDEVLHDPRRDRVFELVVLFAEQFEGRLLDAALFKLAENVLNPRSRGSIRFAPVSLELSLLSSMGRACHDRILRFEQRLRVEIEIVKVIFFR
eukprot:CAMPEP_0168328880 /NCGR_PEP_ID=MMETSP0213-20121227/6775_1 /TAXON_ID=151035 /ORGANISM="Euplotes harpa, Strain FSP1.4" /LENGTH=96 /DNA_ID=CAMNT_0008332097 /DNA_START=897 /DNA_END=1187 /DNA_ORIENTATION=+